jgi:hypothetical protein
MPNPTYQLPESFNPEKDCCLCGESNIEYQNNPDPLKGSICCNICNDTVVIPLRIRIMKRTKKSSGGQGGT